MSTKRKPAAAAKKAAPRRPRGRPSKFTPELAKEICERLSKGEPLAAICREQRMPHVTTVDDWTKRDPIFSLSIAQARINGFEMIAAECLEISNTPIEGVRTKIGKDGIETITEDMLGHRKLQIETRLKLLSKWDPKRYGDRLDTKVEHSGSISLANVLSEIQAGGLPSHDT